MFYLNLKGAHKYWWTLFQCLLLLFEALRVTAKCNPRDISKSWGVQIDIDLHQQQDIQPPLSGD